MDLILFPTYDVPSTLYAHIDARAPDMSAAAFAAWPEPMRREFALLVAEAGISPARLSRATGITEEALARARMTGGLHAMTFADFRAVDEEEDRKRWKQERRVRDA